MRLLTILFLTLLSFSTLVFCNRESVLEQPVENQISENSFCFEGISKNDKTISSEDAIKIANVYLENHYSTTRASIL